MLSSTLHSFGRSCQGLYSRTAATGPPRRPPAALACCGVAAATDDLDARARTVLRALAMLSEAPAARLDADVARPPAGSRIPSGVRLRAPVSELGGPPPADRSLHDHYRHLWELARAAPGDRSHRRHTVVLMAERALEEATHRRPDFIHEDPAEREQRVVVMWAGTKALEVAFAERASVSWVRKIRRIRGLGPDDGLERATPPPVSARSGG